MFAYAPAGWAFALLVLSLGLVSTAWAYFGPYAHDPMTGYWFERGAEALGERAVGFLRQWGDGARVYVDPMLWEQWPQVRFTLAGREGVTANLERAAGGQPPQPGPVAVFVWPYEIWQRAWFLLPAPAEMTVEEGPLSRGDRDPEPYLTYLSFFATPPDPSIPAQVRFSGGLELLGTQVTPLAGDRLRVRLRWRTNAPQVHDYTVFLHYLRDGERIAQADARPAGDRFPTVRWRPGDVINDDHIVEGVGAVQPGRDVLRFGLWSPGNEARLYPLDEAGNPVGEWLDVPVGDE